MRQGWPGIYLLLEHQTTVDRTMPLRLLSYMTEIWLHCARRDGLPLPPLIPFVLHQGPQTWNVSTHFADMIGFPPGMRDALVPWLPQFQHLLLDLSQTDPDTHFRDDVIRAVTQLMKLARHHEVLEFFRWLIAQAQPLPEDLLRTSLLYALHSDEDLDVETLGRILLAESNLQSSAMTLAQKLRQEGRLQGRQEGRQEGRESGLWLGKVQLLENILGLPATPDNSAATKEELQQRFAFLQAEYDRRFKPA